ncbi:MAG: acyltransferase family protein [Methanobrevibacter sp.]|uniref:acyltransferase n=1 Tax=Methanobrevibacter sp. TaxID=66852 RepID=UPI0026E04E1E|nr:acyltransferase family protein [Methanobrevibacter sp.]MDO5849044.1 acyltransferase family protein [Methanobrevibacter sp.]
MFYNKDSKRILWVDWLKVFAIIGVLGLHSSTQFFDPSILYSFNWYVGVFFESLCRYGIILFLMASGFLILRKPEPITNFPRRFKRVFIPFVFWLFVYGIIKFYMINHSFNPVGIVIYLLEAFLNPTNVSIQFWFVYMIIGLYLFAPILSKWLENCSVMEIEYFLVIWVFVSVFQFLNVDTIILDYLRYFSGAIGYFILGYYLAFKDSRYLQSRKFGLFLFLLGTAICFVGTTVGSIVIGGPCYLFFGVGEITPNACLQGIGLFIMIKNTDFGKLSDRINSFAVLISLESYGVYLCNILIIEFLEKFGIFSISGNALVAIPGVFVISFIIANVLIYVMSKLPFLNKFTGFKSIL